MSNELISKARSNKRTAAAKAAFTAVLSIGGSFWVVHDLLLSGAPLHGALWFRVATGVVLAAAALLGFGNARMSYWLCQWLAWARTAPLELVVIDYELLMFDPTSAPFKKDNLTALARAWQSASGTSGLAAG